MPELGSLAPAKQVQGCRVRPGGPHQGRTGVARVGGLLARVAADAGLPVMVRELFAGLGEELVQLEARLAAADARLQAWHRGDEASRRLAAISGIGPITASLLTMKVPDPGAFKSGRDFAAWLGLTPKDHSTAGRVGTGGIARAGDEVLRSLLVVGATSVIRHMRAAPPPPPKGWRTEAGQTGGASQGRRGAGWHRRGGSSQGRSSQGGRPAALAGRASGAQAGEARRHSAGQQAGCKGIQRDRAGRLDAAVQRRGLQPRAQSRPSAGAGRRLTHAPGAGGSSRAGCSETLQEKEQMVGSIDPRQRALRAIQ